MFPPIGLAAAAAFAVASTSTAASGSYATVKQQHRHPHHHRSHYHQNPGVVGGHAKLLPPFGVYDSQTVARCALAAQHKQRAVARANASRSSSRSWQSDNGGGAPPSYNDGPAQPVRSSLNYLLANDANESYLNGLPINQARYENPHRQGALFCRSGTWLEIVGKGDDVNSDEYGGEGSNPSDEYDSGSTYEGNHSDDHNSNNNNNNNKEARRYVRGTRRETSQFTLVEFIAVAFGLVSIRGVSSQNYLCMDGSGHLYAASSSNYTAECVFMEEMLENYYNLYSSCSHGTHHRPWYVALKKTGRARRGQNTRKKQKSSHFLVINFDGRDNDDGVGRSSNSAKGETAASNADPLTVEKSATFVHPRLFSGDPAVVDDALQQPPVAAESNTDWRGFYSTANFPSEAEQWKQRRRSSILSVSGFEDNTSGYGGGHVVQQKQQHFVERFIHSTEVKTSDSSSGASSLNHRSTISESSNNSVRQNDHANKHQQSTMANHYHRSHHHNRSPNYGPSTHHQSTDDWSRQHQDHVVVAASVGSNAAFHSFNVGDVNGWSVYSGIDDVDDISNSSQRSNNSNNSTSGGMETETRRNYRKELRRKHRLFREEMKRRRRKEQLERLRSAAAALTTATHQSKHRHHNI